MSIPAITKSRLTEVNYKQINMSKLVQHGQRDPDADVIQQQQLMLLPSSRLVPSQAINVIT